VIKGVDAQVMMQRGIEYSRDVSAMMRREEAAGEFASRMQQLSSEQEVKTVLQKEKDEQKRVNRDAGREKDGKGGRQDGGKNGAKSGGGGSPHDLPSVGMADSRPLLDIEV